jgi:cob(I)alamin adenosyltransferase
LGDEFTSSLEITKEDVNFLEAAIDRWEEELPELNHFILPGGTAASAQCQVARTVCRRAERKILEFAENSTVHSELIQFINRLSDLLFVLARKLNFDEGVDEITWEQK